LHYSQPSILVVDDEPHVLEALSTILEGRGYRVRVAPNGAMALDEIAIERPDVVLLDLAMPGLDGVEVCRRVRSYSRVPIRVLSQRAILIGVFGPPYEDAVDNLRTFVAQLRRKVEHDPSRPQRIVTEPGLGYRFRSDAPR